MAGAIQKITDAHNPPRQLRSSTAATASLGRALGGLGSLGGRWTIGPLRSLLMVPAVRAEDVDEHEDE